MVGRPVDSLLDLILSVGSNAVLALLARLDHLHSQGRVSHSGALRCLHTRRSVQALPGALGVYIHLKLHFILFLLLHLLGLSDVGGLAAALYDLSIRRELSKVVLVPSLERALRCLGLWMANLGAVRDHRRPSGSCDFNSVIFGSQR